MRLTSYGHACLLVEMADARILIDPGVFSDDFTGIEGLDAIIVTHQHPDHLDPTRFGALRSANPQATILCDPDSVAVLAAADVAGHRVTGVSTIGGVSVTPVGTMHALIHPSIPLVSNIGVRLSAPGEPTFYHPGDALDGEPGMVDVLAFPLNAPWQRSREMTGFIERIGAPAAVPIHDGLLAPRGRELYLTQARTLGAKDTTDIVDLMGAGSLEFPAPR